MKYFYIFFTLLMMLVMNCSTTGKVRTSGENKEYLRESLRKDRVQVASSRIIYGAASFYADEFHGRKTANGEIFDMNGLTAAHRSWPFGTICRVTNTSNEKSVVVRINDRGPFVEGRLLDLSRGAAQALGGLSEGVMQVKVEILEMPSE